MVLQLINMSEKTLAKLKNKNSVSAEIRSDIASVTLCKQVWGF